MNDLPVSSINPNTDTNSTTTSQQDDVVSNLNAILNQPMPLVSPAITQDNQSVDTPVVSAPVDVSDDVQSASPVIQIDLKKNYVKKPQQEATSTLFGSSPFGAPKFSENYYGDEQVTQPEQIVSPEVEKSAEILKPEQAPQPDTQEQPAEKVEDSAPGQIVDLRKPPEAPKQLKKDVAPNASKLTLKANVAESEFIESILGAHGD